MTMAKFVLGMFMFLSGFLFIFTFYVGMFISGWKPDVTIVLAVSGTMCILSAGFLHLKQG